MANFFAKALLIPTVLILSFACSFNNSNITLFGPAADDRDFNRELTIATKGADIFQAFETKYFLRVTYLSLDFRKALEKRVETLYLQNQVSFSEAQSKTGFFVSIFSPEGAKIDLDNNKLWTIIAEGTGFRAPPLSIRKLKEKDRWQPFFPYITKWSQEYLVLFDNPSNAKDALNVADNIPLKLTFSNSDAKVSFSW